MATETFLITFLIFLTVAALVAYAATRLRIPYNIAMVLVGLGVSILHLSQELHLTVELEPDLILLIFLSGLLFEASYHIDLPLLRANGRTILLLAIPGVLISTVIVGVLVNAGLGLPLGVALLFGVMISATDPVAVVALFKELGVNKRLSIIVEGESLFNDGVAIVGYALLTNIALTFILAYGTYMLAEEGLHGLEVDASLLLENIGPLLLGIGAVLVAWFIVVYGLRLVIIAGPRLFPGTGRT